MIKPKNMLALMKRNERIWERGKIRQSMFFLSEPQTLQWSQHGDSTNWELMPSITIEEWNRFQQMLQMEVLVGNMSPSKAMN